MNKKSIVFSILLFIFTGVYASEKTIYVYLGESLTISPWGDRDISTYDMWWTCVSTSLIALEENPPGIEITEKSRMITHTAKEDGYYCYYEVKPDREGVYSLRGYYRCYKFPDTYGYEFITYTVVVTEAPKVIYISGIPSNVEMNIGDTYSFNPIIVEEGAKTTLTWTSSNMSVATVNDGVVIAHNPGTSIVTCTASNGVYTQCVVTVNPKYIKEISLNYTEKEIFVNDVLSLTAKLAPEDATNDYIVWNTSDESVALVGTTGTVVGVSEGYANITAATTDGSNLSASCLVHVVAPKVLATSLTLDVTELELTQGDNATLTTTLQPSNVSSSALRWSSGDESIVTVDEAGTVTALMIGETTIFVNTTDGSDLSATCNVKVKSKSVAEFDNVVYFNDATVLKNCESVLALQLKNATGITAIQFDLALPEGVTIAKNANGTAYGITFEEERADATTHTLNSALQEDGTIRVLCYSTASEIFLNNEGTVLYFPIIVPDLNKGTYNLILQNIVITDKVGNKTNIDAIGSVLNVVEATPGDANGDDEVDVADIVAVANYILGNSGNEFLAEAADYDSDGTIDVADIVNIANHILGGNMAGACALTRSVFLTRGVDVSYSLEVLPFMLEEEGSKTVTLDLYNPGVEFTAFQCDLYLPEGLTVDLNRRGTAYNFSFNADADRTGAAYHTLSSAKQDDGGIRVLCYSTASEIFLGEEGALLNIPLTADASLAEGVYEFSIANTVLTYVNGVKVSPETYKGSIVVGDGGEVQEVKLYGRYTSEVLEEYSTVLAANGGITSVDLTEAIYLAEDGLLTTGNPNTIVYLAEGDALANADNVVVGDECASLVLTDGYAFAAPVAFSASQASYGRELAGGKYGTIVLPFAPDTDDYVFYALTSAGDDVLVFDEVETPVANTPYLYQLRDGKSATRITGSEVAISSELTPGETAAWQMVGSYANRTIAAGEDGDRYYYAYTSSDNKIHQVINTLTVKPYRAYFTTSSTVGTQLAIRTRGGEETLIDVTEVDGLCPEVYYDLSGRRVDNPVEGVYIVNGKKVVF